MPARFEALFVASFAAVAALVAEPAGATPAWSASQVILLGAWRLRFDPHPLPQGDIPTAACGAGHQRPALRWLNPFRSIAPLIVAVSLPI